MNDTLSPSSSGLACLASFFAGGVGGVLLAGWRIAGNGVDWFPSLLIVAIAVVCITVMGKVRGSVRNAASVFATILAICFGHAIIHAQGYAAFLGSPWASLAAYTIAVVGAAMTDHVLNGLAKFVDVPPDSESNMFVGMFDRSWHAATSKGSRWLVGALLVWIIIVGIFYTQATAMNRTGFRIMTVPFDQPLSVMPLAGFSVWHHDPVSGDQPVMIETVPAIEQVQWFSGQIRSDDNFRFLRAGYAFAATFFLGVMQPETALRCINFASWLGMLAVIGGLSLSWPSPHKSEGSPTSLYAALSAVAIAAVGVGFGLQINDTTPHLMAFCLYAIGIAMIVRFDFVTVAQPWSRHLFFALAVGLFSWTYNVAQMLVFVYVLASLRRQRWMSIAGVVAIVLLHRPIWRWSLPALGINVREVEGEYFARAISMWRSSWNQGATNFFRDAAIYTWESVSAMETPWVIAIGLMAAPWMLPQNQRLLWAATWSAPVLSSIVFAPTSLSRGYIVFGGSIVLYLIAGQWLGQLVARPGLKRRVAIGGLLLIVMANFLWTTAHHRGWYGPAKVFLMGWPNVSMVVTSPPTLVLDAAGSRPVPTSLGGDDTEPSGKNVDFQADGPIEAKSIALAFLTRLPFVVSIVLLACFACRSLTSRWVAVGGLSLLSMTMTLVGYASVTRQYFYFTPGRTISLESRQALAYQIQLNPASRERFAEVAATIDADALQLWFGNDGPVDVTWMADDQVVKLDTFDGEPRITSTKSDLPSIFAASVWRFTFVNVSDEVVFLHGWQSADSLGRKSSADSQFLPSIEVRLRHRRSKTLAAVMY